MEGLSFTANEEALAPDQSEAPFSMANLPPAMTGLPLAVFVSQQDARHGPNMQLSPSPRYNPAEAVTVTLQHPPKALGPLSPSDLTLVSRWIELNRTTLENYWSGAIKYIEDMITRIKPI